MNKNSLKNVLSESGTYTVEFALIVVFLVSLFFGLIQVGLIKYTKEALNYAARQGAMAGGLTGRPEAAAGEARAEAVKVPFAKNVSVGIQTGGRVRRSNLMSVTVAADVPLLFKIPLLESWLSTKRIEGKGSYLIEKK